MSPAFTLSNVHGSRRTGGVCRYDETSGGRGDLDTAHPVILGDGDPVATHLTTVEAAIRAAAACLLYTSPSPRDRQKSRMPSSA